MKITPLRAVKLSLRSLYQYLTLHTSYGQKAADLSAYHSLERRRNEIKKRLIETLGRAVIAGPFTGMVLPTESSWSDDGDTAAKLLGCYEEELHPYLYRMLERRPEIAVNVGCAEGYYTVGLARVISCPVYGIDIAKKALEVCISSAKENGVQERVHVSGESSSEALAAIVNGRKGLIVIDCEGAEIELLSAELLPRLRSCDLIIESHDFCVPGEISLLEENFSATHDLVIVKEGSRDPNRFEPLKSLSSLDRWLAICERRPQTMSWLICFARER
jgi:hypothetical protein